MRSKSPLVPADAKTRRSTTNSSGKTCLLAILESVLVSREIHEGSGPVRIKERVRVVVLQVDADCLRVQLVCHAIPNRSVCFAGTLCEEGQMKR